jgi:hypothetical protein
MACGHFSDIACVTGRKRRDFCGLHGTIICGHFSEPRLRYRPQKA